MARKQNSGQNSGSGEVNRLAAENVIVSRSARSLALSIATNEGWDPRTEDQGGGMAADDLRLPLAERAIVLRFWEELAGGRLSLQDWVRREQAKRGGSLPRLAADLLGLDTIPRRNPNLPERQQSASYLGYRNELRKLQEYSQGKYKSAAGARQERIAGLSGAEGGNPYAPASIIVAENLPRYALQFGIRGDWQVSQDVMTFSLKHTGGGTPAQVNTYPSPLHDVILNGGAEFIATTIEEFSEVIGASADLLRVYGLHIQSSEVKRARRVDIRR